MEMAQSLKDTLKAWRTTIQTSSSSPPITSPTPSGMPRRTNKPLTEKRRRARINRSLAELKSIILTDNNNTSGGRLHKQTKLEKADILEMTVRYFYMLRVFESSDVDRYGAGFLACIKEVDRYLSLPDMTFATFAEYIERDFKMKLLRHLESCLVEIESKKENCSSKLSPKKKKNSKNVQQKQSTPPRPSSSQPSPPSSPVPKIKKSPEPTTAQNEPIDYSLGKRKANETTTSSKSVFKVPANPHEKYPQNLNLNEYVRSLGNNVLYSMLPMMNKDQLQFVFPMKSTDLINNPYILPFLQSNICGSNKYRFTQSVVNVNKRLLTGAKVEVDTFDTDSKVNLTDENYLASLRRNFNLDNNGNSAECGPSNDINMNNEANDSMWRPW